MTPQRLEEIATQFNQAYRGNYFRIELTGQEMADIVDLALDGMEVRSMRSNLDETDDWDNSIRLENMMNKNRDYFSKPVQGSRSAHDYGRSGPIEPAYTSSDVSFIMFAVGLVAGTALVVIGTWLL